MRISDWSSDVCSSDLLGVSPQFVLQHLARRIARQFVEDAEPFGGFLPGNSRYGEMVAQFVERQRRARHQHNAGAHDLAHPLVGSCDRRGVDNLRMRKQQRLDFLRRDIRSEEHTSELQSLMRISYAVFCLKKKK